MSLADILNWWLIKIKILFFKPCIDTIIPTLNDNGIPIHWYFSLYIIVIGSQVYFISCLRIWSISSPHKGPPALWDHCLCLTFTAFMTSIIGFSLFRSWDCEGHGKRFRIHSSFHLLNFRFCSSTVYHSEWTLKSTYFTHPTSFGVSPEQWWEEIWRDLLFISSGRKVHLDLKTLMGL